MKNLQLFLAIGIPSLTVLIGILFSNARHDRTDKRMDDIVKKVDDVYVAMAKNTDDIKSAAHRDALEIMRNMTSLHERVAVVEAKQAS